MTKSGVLADGEDAVGGGGGAGQAVVGTGFERGPRVPRARRRGARERAGTLRAAIDAAGGGQATLHTARGADDAQSHGDAAQVRAGCVHNLRARGDGIACLE